MSKIFSFFFHCFALIFYIVRCTRLQKKKKLKKNYNFQQKKLLRSVALGFYFCIFSCAQLQHLQSRQNSSVIKQKTYLLHIFIHILHIIRHTTLFTHIKHNIAYEF
jgi:hypothetical protein